MRFCMTQKRWARFQYSNAGLMLLMWWGLSTVILSSVYSSFILATSLDQSYAMPFVMDEPETFAACLKSKRCRYSC